jgi:hypothetical protein
MARISLKDVLNRMVAREQGGARRFRVETT